jgi:pimeloyl-ACP methyl ester carboxylesterase
MRTASRVTGIFLLAALLAATVQCAENSTEKAKTLASESIKTVQVGDIKMAYKVMGQGEPLVMIIGGTGTMDYWPQEFLDKLSSKYQVIIFDNRGMGYTTASPANFSISQFANDTAGLISTLGIEQANVLGISMGSFVAQELAIEHPEKVKRLILMAGYCGGSHAIQLDPEVIKKNPMTYKSASNLTLEELKNASELLYPPKWLAENPDFFNQPMVIKETSSPENIERQLIAISLWPGTYDRLYRITAPTLIVAGMEDLIIPPENSLILANRINGSWLVRVENAGHGLVIQYPDKLAGIVSDFIGMSATDPLAQSLSSSSLEPGQEKIKRPI